LRSIGYVASSGSRVIVPNIVGLTTSAASTTLTAAGLTLGNSTGSTGTGATSENNGKIASQSVASGSAVDRGTTVTYTTYSYTPPCTPSYSYSEQVTRACNGCDYIYNLIATDVTCGTGSSTVATGQVANCTSNTVTDEFEEFLNASSTQCNYRGTTVTYNSCTQAYTYTYTFYSRARECPSCPCPGL